MGMVATHAKYLANQTLQGLKRRIKDEWNFVLVSAHDAVQGVDTDSGILSVPPCLRASSDSWPPWRLRNGSLATARTAIM